MFAGGWKLLPNSDDCANFIFLQIINLSLNLKHWQSDKLTTGIIRRKVSFTPLSPLSLSVAGHRAHHRYPQTFSCHLLHCQVCPTSGGWGADSVWSAHLHCPVILFNHITNSHLGDKFPHHAPEPQHSSALIIAWSSAEKTRALDLSLVKVGEGVNESLRSTIFEATKFPILTLWVEKVIWIAKG